ncbi:MAG: AFG1 family ATPase [Undibacterium sp.]|nr:AFG1 family ATPase [Undibacterium sp.]
MNVTEFYQHAITERGFQVDAAQLLAVERLQLAYDEWVEYKSKRSNRLTRLITRPEVPRGVYLWGGVGRGKSFLMDSFYSVVPVVRKTRLHFHEFMRAVHRELDDLKGVADPLNVVALRIAKKYRLICFDEFHVSDVADAMLLYNLMRALFENGVSFVMTSNYQPDTLYPDGLHRERMLPTIALIKERLDVLNVDSGNDYRKRALDQVEAYLTPLNASTDKRLREAFGRIAETKDQDPHVDIEGRSLKALRRAGSTIWFDFATLCGGPRSQNDYLEIASRFHTVILSSVPQMSAGMASEARRFTWLIDVFYDNKVKLIMSAEVAPELLYMQGTLSNEFHRTASRIIEMQSRDYMNSDQRKMHDMLGTQHG